MSGQLTYQSETDNDTAPPPEESSVPEGCEAVSAGISGNIWKVPAVEGKRVKAGEVLVIIEAMKMEITVLAPSDGVVEKVICKEGKPVTAGQQLVVLRGG